MHPLIRRLIPLVSVVFAGTFASGETLEPRDAGAELMPLPKPARVLHVAVTGRDTNPGTKRAPFATLERARDEIRRLQAGVPLPAGGVQVLVHGGEYAVSRTFQLGREDSGTPAAPVSYRAAEGESPRFRGGVRLREFRPVTDAAVLERLPGEARAHLVEADVHPAGVTNLIPFELGGFSSGRGFVTHPAMELFVDGEPMQLARWPNAGFVKTGEVPGPLTLQAWDNRPGGTEGRFKYDGDRPSRWVGEPDAWLYGYWFWDWADSYEKIEWIDLAQHEILLAKPWHTYGYRRAQRYYAINALSELDAPGEWYLDRVRGRVYLYPNTDLKKSAVELSTAAFPLVKVDGVSHLRFEGLIWDLGGADGVIVRGGAHVELVGCTIRRMAGNGLEIQGGQNHAVRSCDIHTLGRGGVVMTGGDRKTLAPGGHVLENCHIHHLSRIDHTYTPGVLMNGAGNRVRHNLIHDVASSAMRIEGNDHLIEFNEVHRVVLESDDQGGVDMFGNPTYRGNVYRYNYWHHMGNWERKGEEAHTGQAGIRLDDAICGVLIQSNVFQKCSAGAVGFGGVQIHGGKENIVEGNLFVDCGAAVSLSPWGEKRWREFVAPALSAPAIDRELYLRRYPTLAELAENHDANIVRQNVALRCGKLLLRAPTALKAEENQEFPKGTELAEGADGQLKWSNAEATKLGVAGVPFGQMGLYGDGWRRRHGAGWALGASRR